MTRFNDLMKEHNELVNQRNSASVGIKSMRTILRQLAIQEAEKALLEKIDNGETGFEDIYEVLSGLASKVSHIYEESL